MQHPKLEVVTEVAAGLTDTSILWTFALLWGAKAVVEATTQGTAIVRSILHRLIGRIGGVRSRNADISCICNLPLQMRQRLCYPQHSEQVWLLYSYRCQEQQHSEQVWFLYSYRSHEHPGFELTIMRAPQATLCPKSCDRGGPKKDVDVNICDATIFLGEAIGESERISPEDPKMDARFRPTGVQ